MRLVLAVLLLSPLTALAQPVDVAALYDVTTEGSTAKLKAGEQGKLVIAFKLKGGAHVSDEAPLKIELAGKGAKLSKDKLTLADSVNPRAAGAKDYPEPRFEIPFSVSAAATIDARLSFFICTEKLCARQTKQLSLPVEVL
ncbi:MAG: hypothetical protein ACOZQL_29130 [Myxococcota bacterium]